jgi:hypothetical protein
VTESADRGAGLNVEPEIRTRPSASFHKPITLLPLARPQTPCTVLEMREDASVL